MWIAQKLLGRWKYVWLPNGVKIEVVTNEIKENQMHAPEQLYDLQQPAEFEDSQCLVSSRTANHMHLQYPTSQASTKPSLKSIIVA
jgi:hypothetical protein